MSWQEEAARLVRAFEAKIAPLEERCAISQWELEVTGDEKHLTEYEDLCLAVSAHYADKEHYGKVKGLLKRSDGESDLRRELERLEKRCARRQMSARIIEETTRRGVALEACYNTFRAEIGGKRVTDNDIENCLLNSTDSSAVEEAYRASKSIALYCGTNDSLPPVHEQIREVACLRNEGAREIGYENNYQMSVEMNELGQDWLFKTLDALAEASEGPFRTYKTDLNQKLAARFGCSEKELLPWHYGGRFFQLPPKAGEIDLDPIFADKDVVELTIKTFDRLEIDIRPIVEKSSLYPGDPETSRKCQHAFCTSPDAPDDVRILCNVINNDRWMMVMLHEYGHGVDSAGLARDLPYFIRGHAHTLTTEAIALMMERQRYRSKWLQEIAGVEREQADAIESAAASVMAVKHLVFTRWVMVMCHFERALYERPDDPGLNGYWWDLVERFQGLPRPDSESKPDWASKIHLAGSPAYYQNYLLGEVFGAQLEDYIDEDLGGVALNPAAGRFLNEKMFANGARWPWRDLLKKLTGSDLRLEPFVEKLCP